MDVASYLQRSNTTWSTAYTYTVPAGSASERSSWRIFTWGTTTTTTGLKEVRIVIAGATGQAILLQIPAATTGQWAIEAIVERNFGVASVAVYGKKDNAGVMSSQSGVTPINLDTTDMTIELQTQVASGHVQIRGYKIHPSGDQLA
jgi:hypothetical protein